jgi:hypothetical protein
VELEISVPCSLCHKPKYSALGTETLVIITNYYTYDFGKRSVTMSTDGNG